MRWFKHMTDMLDDAFVVRLIDEYGLEGYGFWVALLELYAKYAKENCGDWVEIPASILEWKMRIRRAKIQRLLDSCATANKIEFNYSCLRLELRIPKMALLKDEWATRKIKNSGVTREQLGPKKEEERKKKTYKPPTPKGGCEHFQEFWNVYPKKQDKAKALTIWQRDKLDAIAPAIIDAVQRFTQTPQWQAENFRYVPKPTTFLNGKRWEDELSPEANKTKAQTRSEAMLDAWKNGKNFLHKDSGKIIPFSAIEPFNHHSQRVTEEKATAFRGKVSGNVAYFTEFEIVQ